MQEVLQHYKTIVIFLFFVVLSVCLITFQLRILDNVILLAFSPVQKVLISLFDDVKNGFSRYHMLFYVRDEFERLRVENIELKSKILKLNESQEQVSRLQKLLLLQQAIPYQTCAAKVIGKSPVAPYSTLIIDKGTKHGIRKFQGVINSFGVIGRIINASKYSSKVQVITDKECSIAALNQKTRDNGLVRGCGYKNPLLQMDFVFYRAKFTIGDQVITSGLDEVFPKGLPIGTVQRIVSQKGDLFYKSIDIEPTVDLNRIEEVLVVLPIDMSTLEE